MLFELLGSKRVAANANNINSPQPSNRQLFRQQFTQLVNTLSSGDLSGAQQAFAALQKQSSRSSDNPFSRALEQIGHALNLDDIAAAQKEFISLQLLVRANRGQHHNYPSGSTPGESNGVSTSSVSEADNESISKARLSNSAGEEVTSASTETRRAVSSRRINLNQAFHEALANLRRRGLALADFMLSTGRAWWAAFDPMSQTLRRRIGSPPIQALLPPVSKALSASIASSDREFLPAAVEIIETPPSPIRIAFLWFICVVSVATLTWSYFGKFDIHAVAQGKIQPMGRSKVVQPLEPGKVVAVLVENGSRINEGDVLLELDPTETSADRNAQAKDLGAATAEVARRRIAINAARSGNLTVRSDTFMPDIAEETRRREQNVLAADLAQLASTLESLKAQLAERQATKQRLMASLAAREKQISLAKERVEMRQALNDKGSGSRALVIEALQQYETTVTTQVGESGQLHETEASLVTLEQKATEATNQFLADQTQKLADAERKEDRLTQELIKAKSKSDRTRLRAPISGFVQQLGVTTVGQVVSGGQVLMTIVPLDAPIEVEAMILNQDIGFVEVGQDAVVKVEAFPFTRYGTIEGKVVRVSRDAVDENQVGNLGDAQSAIAKSPGGRTTGSSSRAQNLVFPTTVALKQRAISIEGKQIPLSPGMAVTAEIRTGERRVIDYVLSPLSAATSRFGSER